VSIVARWKSRLRRWALRRIALPLVNRELREQGVHLYRYVPASDRLFPNRALTPRAIHRERGADIGSDVWYRALAARNLRVPVAFDVGVNYGYTSVWLSRWAEQVHAFEPNPRNAALIREQLSIRGIGNVELTETALSDREGEATLHVKAFDGHHALADIGASPTHDRIRVATTTIDREAAARGIDRIGLLKIDVEGFEAEVLEGARGLLANGAIDLILFEFSPRFHRQRGIDPRAPLAVLERFGYRVMTLDGATLDESALGPVPQIDLLAEPGGRDFVEQPGSALQSGE
jgi:FkbM family methyltransferase